MPSEVLGDHGKAPGLADLLSNVEDESDLDKVLKTFLDPQNVDHLSELSKRQAYAFTVLASIAMKYRYTTLAKLLVDYQTKLISHGRKGRGEFVRIAQRTADPPEIADRKGMFSWLRRD